MTARKPFTINKGDVLLLTVAAVWGGRGLIRAWIWVRLISAISDCRPIKLVSGVGTFVSSASRDGAPVNSRSVDEARPPPRGRRRAWRPGLGSPVAASRSSG